MYRHCNYRGHAIRLTPGSYNMHALIRRGMRNDNWSSIRVHGRCQARLYQHWNFNGRVLVKTGSDSCFTNDRMREEMSLVQGKQMPFSIVVKDLYEPEPAPDAAKTVMVQEQAKVEVKTASKAKAGAKATWGRRRRRRRWRRIRYRRRRRNIRRRRRRYIRRRRNIRRRRRRRRRRYVARRRRRRFVSWNDQISSARVTNANRARCHWDCRERDAKNRERSNKVRERQNKNNERRNKANIRAERANKERAHKERVNKERASKERRNKHNERVNKERAAKERTNKERNHKERARKAARLLRVRDGHVVHLPGVLYPGETRVYDLAPREGEVLAVDVEVGLRPEHLSVPHSMEKYRGTT